MRGDRAHRWRRQAPRDPPRSRCRERLAIEPLAIEPLAIERLAIEGSLGVQMKA